MVLCVFFSSLIFSDEIPVVQNDGKWSYVLEFLQTDPARRERHLKDAEPILSGKISAFNAFRQGYEKAITAYLKLDNEDRPIRKIIDEIGVVNEETVIMCEVLKNLLSDIHSVKFVKKGKDYVVVFSGKSYPLKELLEFVNFNQITFSAAMLDKYHQYIDTDIINEKPWLPNVYGRPTAQDFKNADPEGIAKKISLAEKEAINIYTGSAYFRMNAFLRGNLNSAIDTDNPKEIDRRFKEILLNSAVAISGLNKMPDFIPPPNHDGSVSKHLYRGEYSVPDAVLEKRQRAVQEGGDITLEGGFLSTAYQRPAEGFFGESAKCGIMFINLKGKNITPLSQFGSGEREVLMPPTHIQWRYHKDVKSDYYQTTVALFLAKPVTAPIGKAPMLFMLAEGEELKLSVE